MIRTYLLDWMVQRPMSDPYKLIVSSDWGNLNANQQVKYVGFEHKYLNSILVETIVKYEVSEGTPNQIMQGDHISLPIKWNELASTHLTTIISYLPANPTNLTDNDNKTTFKTPIY